jgi:hypothetical protein
MRKREPIKPPKKSGNDPSNWSPEIKEKMAKQRLQCGSSYPFSTCKGRVNKLEPKKAQSIGVDSIRTIIERPRKIKLIGKQLSSKTGKWVESGKGATNARLTQEREAWAAKNKRK